MRNDGKSEQSDDRPACSWCGRRLPPEEQERAQVCGKCVRLLRGAGLRDEEIFDPPKKKLAFR